MKRRFHFIFWFILQAGLLWKFSSSASNSFSPSKFIQNEKVQFPSASSVQSEKVKGRSFLGLIDPFVEKLIPEETLSLGFSKFGGGGLGGFPGGGYGGHHHKPFFGGGGYYNRPFYGGFGGGFGGYGGYRSNYLYHRAYHHFGYPYNYFY